jgi:ketosteroid isomerase-like protein
VSQENVDLVERSLVHWLATGEPSWELVDESMEAYDHDIMDAGEYRGREGVERWLSDWESAWSNFRMEVQELIDAGEDLVVAFVHMRARGRESGVEVSRDDAILYRVCAGKIMRMDYFNNRAQALAAAGLAE